MHVFERTLELPISRAELFAWHERPGAFDRLSPSWEHLEGSVTTNDNPNAQNESHGITGSSEGWVAANRPGTRSAELAQAATKDSSSTPASTEEGNQP